MHYFQERDFRGLWPKLLRELLDAPPVRTGEWQSIINPDMPQAETLELQDVTFQVDLTEGPRFDLARPLRELFRPSLPWAEDHFRERISGKPFNPPPSSTYWPFAVRKHEQHVDAAQKFSHTYPERMWPKYVGRQQRRQPRYGVRFALGDLHDLIKLLRERPGTRQAFLPIWFPEDTGAVQGQRVPCTLGYHFMIRDGVLTTRYYMRSCDIYRHFRDDLYMAARLAQTVKRQARHDLTLGPLTVHIASLHCFKTDARVLATLYRRAMEELYPPNHAEAAMVPPIQGEGAEDL